MRRRDFKIAIIPMIVILVGFLTASIAYRYINEWAFIPLSIVYWGVMLLVVKPTREKLKAYFNKTTGNSKSNILAFIPVLFCIVSFVWGIQYIHSPILITLWIIFAIINSFTEELFWRGYLLDNLGWSPITNVIYTTILFYLSHPLMWGVFSITIRSYIMILPLLVMGLTWGYVYQRTKSLKWCVIAHFFVDILNLSTWVFLNIYVPPIIK